MRNFVWAVVAGLSVIGSSLSTRAQGIPEAQDYAFGHGLYKDGMYQQAYAELSKFVENYPNSLGRPEASFLVADCAFRLGKYDEASLRFESFTKNYPNSSLRADAYFRLGESSFKNGQYEKATARFKLVLDEYEKSPLAGEAAYWLGESYLRLNKFDLALKYYQVSFESYPANRLADYALYSAGWASEKRGEFAESIDYYSKLINSRKTSELRTTCIVRVGACRLALKQYQEAIEGLTSAMPSLVDSSERGEAVYLIGEGYYNLGDYTSAERQYKSVRSDYFGHKLFRDATYSLGWAYLKQNQYQRAAETFGEIAHGSKELAHAAAFRRAIALKLGGDNAAARSTLESILSPQEGGSYADNAAYELGLLNYESKVYAAARKNFSSVIDSYPESDVRAEAYRMLGETEIALKNYDEAQKAFQAAVSEKNAPAEIVSEALFQEGWSLYKLKNYQEAVDRLEEFRKQFPSHEKSIDAVYWVAEALYQLGKYSAAREDYTKVVQAQPRQERFEDALYGLAWSSYNLNEFAQAANEFERLVAAAPNGKLAYDARLRAADCYLAQKDFGRSAKAYEKIIALYPENGQTDYAYYQLAQSYSKSGNSAKALETFRHMISAFPSSDLADDAQYGIAWIYFTRKEYAASITEFQRLISTYPKSELVARAYYSIGDADYNLQHYDWAIASYRQILTKFPTSTLVGDAITGVQYCLEAQGKHEESLKVIDEFVRSHPNAKASEQVAFKKTELLYGQKKYSEAIAECRSFIDRYPKSTLVPDAYFWVGKSSILLGQPDKALQALNHVANTYPSSQAAENALLEIGNLYLSEKNFAEAVSMYERIEAKFKDSDVAIQAAYQKGVAYELGGKPEKARGQFDALIKKFPESIFSGRSKLHLARIYRIEGKVSETLALLNEVATSRTDELGAEAQFELGVSRQLSGEYEEAISAFLRVKYVYPSAEEWVARSYLRLGECYKATKQIAKAKNAFEIVLKSHQNDEFGKEAEQKLKELQES
jgi:TolA-binding protein